MLYKYVPDKNESYLAKRICDEIYDEISTNLSDDSTLFIVDPHLLPLEHLYEPLRNKSYDSQIWSYFLYFIFDLMKNGKVLVYTKEPLDRLKDQIPPKYRKLPIPLHTLLNIPCELLITRYEKNNRFNPRQLHDRLIILEGKVRMGYHIGGSLASINKYDCTVTKFEDANLYLATQRLKEIWSNSLK